MTRHGMLLRGLPDNDNKRSYQYNVYKAYQGTKFTFYLNSLLSKLERKKKISIATITALFYL